MLQRTPISIKNSKIRFAISASILFVLGACSNSETNIRPEAPNQPSSVNRASSNPKDSNNASPIISDVVTQPIIEESQSLPDINTLANLTPRAIENLMGAPDLKRVDGNIQVFLYESSSCVLEVILEENTQGEFKSESIKTRDRQGNIAEKSSCLTSLLPDGWQN
jgi:hypothetical protein